jgi:ribosomal protein L22
MPECFYPQYETVKFEGPTCKSMKRKIHHTVYKLAMIGQMIKGLHLYDAQNALNNTSNKKAS